MNTLFLLFLLQGQTFIISPAEMTMKGVSEYSVSINRWLSEGLQYEGMKIIPTAYVTEFVDKREDQYPLCDRPECKLDLLRKYDADYLCTFSVLCIKDKCTINFLTFADYKHGDIENRFSWRKEITNSVDSLKDSVEEFVQVVSNKTKHVVKRVTFWSGVGLTLLSGALIGIHFIDTNSNPHIRSYPSTLLAGGIVGGVGLTSLIFSWVY